MLPRVLLPRVLLPRSLLGWADPWLPHTRLAAVARVPWAGRRNAAAPRLRVLHSSRVCAKAASRPPATGTDPVKEAAAAAAAAAAASPRKTLVQAVQTAQTAAAVVRLARDVEAQLLLFSPAELAILFKHLSPAGGQQRLCAALLSRFMDTVLLQPEQEDEGNNGSSGQPRSRQTSRALVSFLWSLAKYHPQAFPDELALLLQQAIHDLPHMNPVDLNLVAWSLGAAQLPSPHLARTALQKLVRLMPAEPPPRLISTVLWANSKHPGSLQGKQLMKLSRLLMRHREEATAQTLSLSLWSLATIDFFPGGKIMQGLLRQARRLAATGSAPGSPAPSPPTQAAAGPSGTTFKAQTLSMLAWACARLRYLDSDCLLALVQAFCRLPERKTSAQSVANLLWAVAMLEPSGRSAEAVRHWATRSGRNPLAMLAAFPQRELLMAAWALVLLDCSPAITAGLWSLVHRLLSQELGTGKASSHDIGEDLMLRQALQIFHSAALQSPTDARCDPALLELMHARAGATVVQVSWFQERLQVAVAMAVAALGLLDTVCPEFLVNSTYRLDTALPQHRIAFDADGPLHYIRNTLTPLGDNVMRERHLAAWGWKIVHVPFHKNLQGQDLVEEVVSQLQAALAQQ